MAELVTRVVQNKNTSFLHCNGAIKPLNGLWSSLSKVELVFLPPYAPNLNLIERYWKYFKKIVLYNRYYEKFDDFKTSCELFFKNIKKHKTALRSLLTENFHIVGKCTC